MFLRRLQQWLNKPVSDKIESIRRRFRLSTVLAGFLMPIFKIARSLDFRTLRLAAFDSIPKSTAFVLATVGKEQFLCQSSDVDVSRMTFVDGVADFEKIEKAIQCLGQRFKLHTLVDVGANIGTICIPAVARGLAQRAIAIEPAPTNFRTLMANIYLNDVADRIVSHNQAVGQEDGQTLRFDLSPHNSGDHRVHSDQALTFHFERDRKSILVPSSRLDTLIQSPDRSSMLIWMDTQGYEGFILKGAQRLLQARVPMVVEFWPYGMTSAGSFPALREGLLNYTVYFDLGSKAPKPKPLSESALDTLFSQYDGTIGFTDILVV
jgi:FkbM family methyltransferase